MLCPASVPGRSETRRGNSVQVHKSLIVLALAAVLVWGTAATDEALKVGIVDIDQAISSTTEGKSARE